MTGTRGKRRPEETRGEHRRCVDAHVRLREDGEFVCCSMDSLVDSGMMDILRFAAFPKTITVSTFNVTIILAFLIAAYFTTYIFKAQSVKQSKSCEVQKPSKVSLR